MKKNIILSLPAAAGRVLPVFLFCTMLFCLSASAEGEAKWWDKAWTVRKPIVVDTAGTGVDLGGPVKDGVVLVRLHAGNFNFLAGREDGGDLRFVSEDGTVLPHQIESFDALMNEGFVWVRVPEIAPGAQNKIWLYSGNPSGEGGENSAPADPKKTFGDSALAVFQFAERNRPAQDSGPLGIHASNAASPAEGALIGVGARFLGRNPVLVESRPEIAFSPGGELTLRAWLRPQSHAADAVWFSRFDGGSALRLGLADGVPYIEVVDGGAARRSTPTGDAAPLPTGRWSQVALVAKSGSMELFVNGKPAASLAAPLPAIASRLVIGAEDQDSGSGRPGFIGEMDAFALFNSALESPALLLSAVNQSGSEESMKLLVAGDDEGGSGGGHNETLEHVMLFGDIARNMMFDGWIAVGICILMIIVGWGVGIGKFFYLNRLQKGNDLFFKLWKKVTAGMSLLDANKEDGMEKLVKELPKQQRVQLKESPLYHIYHRGLEEIESRLGGKAKIKMDGLSARSMQAIRASMDASLVHENHRLNNGIVFLTIGIAGGPYVGLLGTVVGVMITFALIAKTGEVEVNSIAPGIASALLATVFGLLVAIPALFIYSYLSGRIKNTLSSMEVFIDDFVAKIAEFYPPPNEKNFVPVPEFHVRGQMPVAPPVLSDGATGEVPAEPSARTSGRHS